MLIAITIILFLIGSILIKFTDYNLSGAIIATLGILTILWYNGIYELIQWIKRK